MTQQHSTGRRATPGQCGFTLIELMIVVAIVAILVAVAYPSYREHVRKSNRAEGQAMLVEAATLQERFFSNRNTYTDNMTDLGLDTTDPAISEHDLYAVDAAACDDGTLENCYVLTATARPKQADDTACVTMRLDNRGEKLPDPVSSRCWR